jgi:uncharacterized protein (DUF2141 family)
LLTVAILLAVMASGMAVHPVVADEENLQPDGNTHSLSVTIVGLETTEGQVMVAVFNQEEGFLRDPLKGQLVAIDDDRTATTSFDDLSAGAYAVSVIHDENGNGKLDTSFIGMPKEPVGVSNDPKPRMGPPRYKDAVFQLTADMAITVSLGKPVD